MEGIVPPKIAVEVMITCAAPEGLANSTLYRVLHALKLFGILSKNACLTLTLPQYFRLI